MENIEKIELLQSWFDNGNFQPPSDAFESIQNIYYEQNKIAKFIRDNTDFIDLCLSQKNDFDILKNHPILGNCDKRHAFFDIPLYRHIKVTEPQFTIALAEFFNEKQNQIICKTFVQSIFKILHKEANINGTIMCKSEIKTIDVQNKKNKKRIDNIFIWDENMLCLEVKFDAQLSNSLEIYQEECQAIANKQNIKNIEYIVISKKNLQEKINNYIQTKNNKRKKNKLKIWCNLLWQDVLKIWEEEIIKQNINEDSDIKRYRTSLWYKVLNKEA